MPTKCIVYFDNNPNRIVYTDQYLRGTVILTLTKTKKLHGVYMKITGKGHAQWKEKYGERYQNAAFGGDEEYLYEKIDLVVCTGNQGKENYILSDFKDSETAQIRSQLYECCSYFLKLLLAFSFFVLQKQSHLSRENTDIRSNIIFQDICHHRLRVISVILYIEQPLCLMWSCGQTKNMKYRSPSFKRLI